MQQMITNRLGFFRFVMSHAILACPVPHAAKVGGPAGAGDGTAAIRAGAERMAQLSAVSLSVNGLEYHQLNSVLLRRMLACPLRSSPERILNSGHTSFCLPSDYAHHPSQRASVRFANASLARRSHHGMMALGSHGRCRAATLASVEAAVGQAHELSG